MGSEKTDEGALQLSTPAIEKFLNVFSEALGRAFLNQTHSTGKPAINATTSDGATNSEPPPAPVDPFHFKKRIGRISYYQDGRTSWVDQNRWEELNKKAEVPVPTVSDVPAVLYQDKDNKKWLCLRSEALVKAYRKTNQHPPLSSETNKSSIVVEIEPFPTLFHHLEDIRLEIERYGNESAKLDFQALEFVLGDAAQRWKDAREEKNDDGFVRYDTIWKLFYPGDLVVRKDVMGNEWLLILVRLTEIKTLAQIQQPPKDEVEFVVWALGWDRVENRLKRKVAKFTVEKYADRRPITSLPVYPIRYKEYDQTAFMARIAERGRKWKDLMAGSSCCRMHDGVAVPVAKRRRGGEIEKYDTEQFAKLQERVIIDAEMKMTTPLGYILGTLAVNKHAMGILGVSDLDDREGYHWDSLPSDTVLTPEQAQLCPPVIGCYGISSDTGYIASVDNLEMVKWNSEAIDSLVLEEDNKQLLKGLVQQHSHRAETKEGGDLIENKGKGLVILLHGPPGVGKTLTAESIAEWVGKPLIALSIGDLIVDESALERRLLDEFKKALEWDAILLLDEADVVLETRSFEDVRRNGIVSVFLRQLEYYKGVLFLTTNRISTMDVAFQSRIQVAIEYEELKPKPREMVWQGLLKKRQDTVDAKSFENILENIGLLANAKLNGRQIRNVLNVAEGLAFNEYGYTGQMQVSHIQKAVKAALDFQKFFDNARLKARNDQSIWVPGHSGSDLD